MSAARSQRAGTPTGRSWRCGGVGARPDNALPSQTPSAGKKKRFDENPTPKSRVVSAGGHLLAGSLTKQTEFWGKQVPPVLIWDQATDLQAQGSSVKGSFSPTQQRRGAGQVEARPVERLQVIGWEKGRGRLGRVVQVVVLQQLQHKQAFPQTHNKAEAKTSQKPGWFRWGEPWVEEQQEEQLTLERSHLAEDDGRAVQDAALGLHLHAPREVPVQKPSPVHLRHTRSSGQVSGSGGGGAGPPGGQPGSQHGSISS